MVGIVQVFVVLLIVVSFAMVVGVPVILATPGEWEKSQSIVWSGAGLWSALVIITGIFNVVPAQIKFFTTKKEVKTNSIIYSGLYNKSSSLNNLNQFIQAEKITKDLNPEYGTIQKLFTRNTNVLAFCENKILKILANKDALFNGWVL